MNTKGFTLTELIITIALIGLIGILVTASSLNDLKKEKEKTEQRITQMIEDAACTYAITSDECKNGCRVSGDTLVNEGLIDEFINEKDMKAKQVQVSFVNGERICTLQ